LQTWERPAPPHWCIRAWALPPDAPVPSDVFLRAVDIVLAQTRKQVQATRKQIADNRALLVRIRRRHRPRRF
jgi:hypothetical protein